MSKNVVNSIFDDDMFSSTPSQPVVKESKPSSNTFSLFAAPDDKPVTPDAILGTTSSQKPLPVVKNKPSIPVRSAVPVADEEEIPEPEPFPEDLLASYDPKPSPTEQPNPPVTSVTQPVKEPEPPVQPARPAQPAVQIPPRQEKAAEPKPVSIPPRQETPVKSTPAPSQPASRQAEAPRASASSVASLPSPFSSDFVMPPRDGGMGETPKARVMQEKLFFRYANAYLGQRGITMDSFSDFLNGVNFIMLVEAVSHMPMSDSLTVQCKATPESRDDAHRNFHFACQFLSDIGKPLPPLALESKYRSLLELHS